MKSASQWSKGLQATLGLSLRPPVPLLGNGRDVVEATIAEVQYDILQHIYDSCVDNHTRQVVSGLQMLIQQRNPQKVVDSKVQQV